MPTEKPHSTMPTTGPIKGFQLPPPAEKSGRTPVKGYSEHKPNSGTPREIKQVPSQPPTIPDTRMRDISIGIVILIACMIIFLFAKKKYANWLVKNRKNPKSASAAGLWLFILLTCLAAAAIFPLLRSETFLNVVFLGGVGGMALIALVFMVIKSK